MQTLPIYLYNNIIDILYSDVAVPNRGDKVYQRDLKAYKGVNNIIKLQVKNNDQKKVNMSNRFVQFNIVDRNNRVNYLTKTADNVNATDGLFSITLSEGDLLDLYGQWYNYSVTVVNADGTKNVSYVDNAFDARGNIQIVDGVYPDFSESVQLLLLNGSEYTGATDARADLNRNPALHTAQVYFGSAFTGTVTAQASMSTSIESHNDEFFDVAVQVYNEQSDPVYFNFTGIYAQVRFRVETISGTVDKILYRS